MLGTNENHRLEDSARNSYDVRIGALEKEVAVMQSNLATKDDFHALRTEMQASHERILTLLYEHKLEFQQALAQQREYFNAALAKQREEFYAALAETKLDLHKALIGHIWKLYGFASLVVGGVYFIARYVH